MSLEAAASQGRHVDALPLLDWKVPVAHNSYTRRDTAFYALSIGLGHDPLNERQFKFIDPWNPKLVALPSMALVLGYPGFWLGDERVCKATGLRPTEILHVEQAIELHAALPVQAAVVGSTSVTGLVDKGKERGCLLYSERAVHLADSGVRLATCRQVHYLRGCGGFGDTGFMAPSSNIKPNGAPVKVLDSTTRPEQALLYRLNGDANALHFDPRTAADAGMPRPILHGMASMGMVGYALLAALLDDDPSRMQSMSLRMTGPIFPGDTLRTEIWENGAFRTRALERNLVVIDYGHVTVRHLD